VTKLLTDIGASLEVQDLDDQESHTWLRHTCTQVNSRLRAARVELARVQPLAKTTES
jgi:hypothetical protein